MARWSRRTGWHGTLTQMGWFFTKAALLTFGGAYAVLPYVYQGAVEQHHWLTRGADDRRPGAGRNHAGAADHGGGLRRLRRRLDEAGARARTRCSSAARWRPRWSPSSPSCRRSSSSSPAGRWSRPRTASCGFTAPLTAITAAVVGVILNLALFFAYHVLWPQGFGGRFDAVSALIAVAAAVALFRFKVGVMPLLGACAASGWRACATALTSAFLRMVKRAGRSTTRRARLRWSTS